MIPAFLVIQLVLILHLLFLFEFAVKITDTFLLFIVNLYVFNMKLFFFNYKLYKDVGTTLTHMFMKIKYLKKKNNN